MPEQSRDTAFQALHLYSDVFPEDFTSNHQVVEHPKQPSESFLANSYRMSSPFAIGSIQLFG